MHEREFVEIALRYFLSIGSLSAPAYAHWVLCPREDAVGDRQLRIALLIMFVAIAHIACGILLLAAV